MSNSRDCMDVELKQWDSIKGRNNWTGLLVGNGASRAVRDSFRYDSLYDKANSNAIKDPLSPGDTMIFESMDTKDFERVLAALWTTEVVCKALGRYKTADRVHVHYESIKTALIEAVHVVHAPWSEIVKVLTKIHSALLQYESVYSTNYDLLLYWAIMTEKPIIFKDYFWSESSSGAKVSFDITNTELSRPRILYLHGGLHLVHLLSGETRKLTAKRGQLLAQFDESLEHGETPLFVTEGTAKDKLVSINRSSYLSFAYKEFTKHTGDLVIFGHSLGESDNHLIQAMRRWGERNIAISMRQGDSNSIRTRQAKLVEALPKAELLFFDAETHPLGKLKRDNSL